MPSKSSKKSNEPFAGMLAAVRSVRYPLLLSITTAALTFAFGICGFLAFEKSLSSQPWIEMWNRWDAPHFLDIAELGYPHSAGSREFLIVLLPVYPLAIRLLHLVVPSWHLAGILVSTLCCAGAFIYLYLLARLEFDERTARRAVFFFAIFPTAYFLHVAYSESIFLLLTIGAFYHARRAQWLVCGLFGLLATGTRIPGAAILAPLALEYLQQRNFRWREIRWDCAYLALVPLGAVAYLFINYHYFSNPLHFLAAQHRVWGAFLRWPFPSVAANWFGLLHASAAERVIQYGGPFVAFVVATAAIVAAPFCLRPCFALYLFFSWVMIFFNNFPVSSPRYLLAVFPLFLLLARLCRAEWLRDSVAFVSILLYALCVMHFLRGWWAF